MAVTANVALSQKGRVGWEEGWGWGRSPYVEGYRVAGCGPTCRGSG